MANKGSSKFQYIIIAIFAVGGVVAMIVFSQQKGEPSDPRLAGTSGHVSIWGTFPGSMAGGNVNDLYLAIAGQNGGNFTVTYTQKDEENFDQEIIEALASGVGPDILLLPNELLMRHTNKILPMPYEKMTDRVFRDTFIRASEIYLRQSGILAMPVLADPMVMYWNRDIFTNASIAVVPKKWPEFLTLVLDLTKLDKRTRNIIQSGLAFGEYVNVTHAKDIIALLMLQAGNEIIGHNGDTPYVALGGARVSELAAKALRFYTDFSSPVKPIYSWSRALPESKDLFIAGDLAVYFGYASELSDLQTKNPHLNFDVAIMPQVEDTSVETTYTRLYGFAVLRSSHNPVTAQAFTDIVATDPSALQRISDFYGLPPVRRDLLSRRPTNDQYIPVFYDSVLRGRTWLDPLPSETDRIFQEMVESVGSGGQSVGGAIVKAASELDTLLRKYTGI